MGFDGSDIRRAIATEDKRNQSAAANLTTCRTCLQKMSRNAENCPHCGEPQREYAARITSDKNGIYSRLCAYAGAGMLIVGSFCPVISAPMVGGISMFNNGDGDGVALLIFAALSAVFAFFDKRRWLFYTAAGCIIILGFDFYSFRQKMSELAEQTAIDLAGNPFAGLADIAVQSVQMQWGWGVLLLGTVLLFSSAFLAVEKCP